MKDVGEGNRFVTLIGLFGVELFICSIAVSGFGLLASRSVEPFLHEQNVAILKAIRDRGTPILDHVASFLSWFGGPQGITIIGLLATVTYFWRGQKIEAATLAAMILGGTLLSLVLKPYFQRPRPDLFEPLVTESGYSFPSSHALVGFCLYGGLAALLVFGSPREHLRWFAGAMLLIFASGIAWSRLYLGVHWLTDVVAGTLVAFFWLAVCLGSIRAFRHQLRISPDMSHDSLET